MSETKRCPQCQAEIPAGAPEGLCPQCLLQAGLESKTTPPEPQKTAAYTPGGAGFVPPTPAELQPAFPQLEILELLGKGGMGAVYKAKQRGLDRLVAVKILPPEFSQDPAFGERFLREAKALAMLSHPNIVGVHDVGQTAPSPPAPLPQGARGGYCYFIMEFVDGVNLRQAMRAGTLKPAEALKIVPQICDALQFAHDEGIVHRDIKPENILLDKKGRVKIADFGLAKLLGKTPHDISLTGTQQVMGTMHYMAPEQIEGARDVDHRADIYSLGVIFYEMLTGELPIGRFAAPSKKVQIDVRLDEVVLRSLEKEPELRYQHASEIKTEVEGIVSSPAPAVTNAPAAEDSEKAYFNLPPGQRVLVDYYLNAVGYDLEKALVVVAAMDELERAVLENYLSKILAIRIYRQKTGAGVSDAKAAVEAIAKKHGVEFPVLDWKMNFGLVTIAVWVLGGFLAICGYAAWFYSGLSPIIAVPLMLLLALPNVLSAWKNWGTPAGNRSAIWAAVILFAPVGIPLVSFLLDPEPTLNWLYAVTGIRPGPRDASLVRLIFWGGLFCLLIWLINWMRTLMVQNVAEKPPQNRHQQASEIKSEVEGTGIEVFCKMPWSKLGAAPICTITDTASLISTEHQLAWEKSVFIRLEPGAHYRLRIRRPSDFISFKARLAFFLAEGEVKPLLYESPPISFMAGKITTDRSARPSQYRSQHAREIKAGVETIARAPAPPPVSPSAQKTKNASVKRPWGVPILGVINLLVGLVFLFAGAAWLLNPDPVPAAVADDEVLRPLYNIWRIAEPVAEYVAAMFWFAGGIGLLLWKPWARRVTVATAVFLIAWFVLSVPAAIAFDIQPAFEEIQRNANGDQAALIMATTVVFLTFTFMTLIGLIYQIAVIAYLGRPRIVAAFEGNGSPPAGTTNESAPTGDHTGPPPHADDPLEQLVIDQWYPGRKIAAIVAYREKTGAGLAEAKAAVEKIAEKYRLPGRKTKVKLGHVLIMIGAGVLLTLILLSPFVYAAAAAAAISVQLLLFGAGVAASFLALVAVWKEWWQSPSPFVWKVIRSGLLLVSLLCLWCFLSSSTTGTHEGVRFEIGSPSPWLRYWPVPGEGFQINPVSWSTLALVGGWLAFWAYRRTFVESQPAAPTQDG